MDNCILLALDNANEANLTQDELEAQHKRKEFISIRRLSILKAKEEGREEGLEEGREEGRKRQKEEMIITAYRNGTPTYLIGSFVGMSEEEVIEFLRGVKDL